MSDIQGAQIDTAGYESLGYDKEDGSQAIREVSSRALETNVAMAMVSGVLRGGSLPYPASRLIFHYGSAVYKDKSLLNLFIKLKARKSLVGIVLYNHISS